MLKNIFSNQRVKDALVSILIGAFVAFLSALLEGLFQFFRGLEQGFPSASAMLYYTLKTWNIGRIG